MEGKLKELKENQRRWLIKRRTTRQLQKEMMEGEPAEKEILIDTKEPN